MDKTEFFSIKLPSFKCAVCKSILVLSQDHSIKKCHFCGVSFATIVACEKGHFVCPTCSDIHADPSDFDTIEKYEEVRSKAFEEYDDRADKVGSLNVLIVSSTPIDRKEELWEIYDIEHEFQEE